MSGSEILYYLGVLFLLCLGLYRVLRSGRLQQKTVEALRADPSRSHWTPVVGSNAWRRYFRASGAVMIFLALAILILAEPLP